MTVPPQDAKAAEQLVPDNKGSATGQSDKKHDSYAALRYRDFRWYVVSLFAMTLGSQLQAVIVGWQIYDITHDPLSLGLIGLAEAFPFLGLALPSGYFADRFNRQRIAAGALFVLALCSVALLLMSADPTFLIRTGARPVYA